MAAKSSSKPVRLTITVEVENVDPTAPPPVAGPGLYEAVTSALLDESPQIYDEEEEYVITRATATAG